MRALYLDLSSGIAGDMLVGALIDLGADAAVLERELAKLALEGYHLHVRRGHKASIAGVKFDVHLAPDHDHAASEPAAESDHSHAHDHGHDHEHGHHDRAGRVHEPAHGPSSSHVHPHAAELSGSLGHAHGRNFSEIRQLIASSTLSGWVKEKALAVFRRLAAAEGGIHGVPVEQVTFHEVGAVDSIIDIVGACIGLELLGKPRVLASLVVEGTGWVDCAHGRFPIPAPATLAILGVRGVALSQCEETHELVTPTGAALVAELAESFAPMRGLVAERIGFGLGTRDLASRPNALRAILGQAASAGTGAEGSRPAHDWQTDTVAVLETNLDDINAELLGHFVEYALAAGALEVFHTPIQMKKNRPGVLLTVLCAEADADRFSELMLRETTAFGVRRHVAERRKLDREFITLPTPHGDVTLKLGRLDGRVVQSAPEFESCRQAAERAHVPLKQVYEAVRRAIPHGLLK
jgi:pyridinium-3,5-bisthiocarboxylic acid mononucleotide nickel chelatase